MYNRSLHTHPDLIPADWMPVDSGAPAPVAAVFGGRPVHPEDLTGYVADHGLVQRVAVLFRPGSRFIPARAITIATLTDDNGETHYVVSDSTDPHFVRSVADATDARALAVEWAAVTSEGWDVASDPLVQAREYVGVAATAAA